VLPDRGKLVTLIGGQHSSEARVTALPWPSIAV